jgi:cation diffusion facilitator family transporter
MARPERLTGLPVPTQLARVAAFPQSAVARPLSADARSAAIQRTLLVVLALNAIVTVAKIIVGARTGTLTVLGAALESGLDMLNNVVGVILVALAGRAPDENHPYGHDKFETLGALGIVVFLSISCFELMRQGIVALRSNRMPRGASHVDLAVVASTLVVNAFVVWYERRRGKQLGSAFLLADAAHTGSDILVTLLAITSLLFAHVEQPWIDAVLAIAVALIIAWSGMEVLRQSIPVLVDERAIDATRLRSVVLSVSDIRDVRNVRSRSTPSGQLFAEVTIAVAGTTPVDAAHRLADAVEAAIEREFGTSQVTVHVEPV